MEPVDDQQAPLADFPFSVTRRRFESFGLERYQIRVSRTGETGDDDTTLVDVSP